MLRIRITVSLLSPIIAFDIICWFTPDWASIVGNDACGGRTILDDWNGNVATIGRGAMVGTSLGDAKFISTGVMQLTVVLCDVVRIDFAQQK